MKGGMLLLGDPMVQPTRGITMAIHLFPGHPGSDGSLQTTGQNGQIKHAIIDQVGDYWASLPRTGPGPQRASIQAADIPDALPHLVLAQLVTPRVARLRIVGHKVEELIGVEMRGMPLTTLFAGEGRAEIQAATEHVSRGAKVLLSLAGEKGFGMPHLDAVMALMPLTDPSGKITHLLGVLETAGTPGRRPRRFALAQSRDISQPSAQPPQPAQKPKLRVIKGGLA